MMETMSHKGIYSDTGCLVSQGVANCGDLGVFMNRADQVTNGGVIFDISTANQAFVADFDF